MNPEHRLAAASSAVVVIDIQNDFCHPEGIQAVQGRDVARVRPVVDRIVKLLPRARSRSVPVVLVRTTHSPATDTPEWLARHPDPTREQSCAEGTWGAEFFRIAPEPDDVIVEKHRYNAFTGTSLDQALAALGRRSLLFCGVTSNTCVETTLRDAVCRDYLATMVEDCCGAYSAEAHERAVGSVAAGFGVIADSTAVLEAWDESTGAAPTVSGADRWR